MTSSKKTGRKKQRAGFLPVLCFHIARLFIAPFILRKYHFRTDRVPKLTEPCLMVSNHTTEVDMLMTGTAFHRHISFVCSDHIVRMPKFGKLIHTCFDPIPLAKGGSSLSAMREVLRRLKAGKNVMLFPEGRRSYCGETIPCGVSIGKLIKQAHCALVTYRITGGYFAQPRWSRQKPRFGPVEGAVTGVYSSEALLHMTAEEITALVNKGIEEHAYQTQRTRMDAYHGENRARDLEKFLFICPRCGREDTMQADGDHLRCSACGLDAFYDEHGFLKGKELPFDTVLEWGQYVEHEFDARISARLEDACGDTCADKAIAPGPPSTEASTDSCVDASGSSAPLFTDSDVTLTRKTPDYRDELLHSGDVTVYLDRIEAGGYCFPFEKMTASAVMFTNILQFTSDGTFYELKSPDFHAWKCARLRLILRKENKDPEKAL